MGLELRFKSDGQRRMIWYASFTDSSGVRRSTPLATQMVGTPGLKNGKASISVRGDAEWERSRAEAEAELAGMVAEERRKGRADHLTEKLIASKTGRAVEYVRLDELAQRWRSLPRDSEVSDVWAAWCDGVFNRFAAQAGCAFMHEVTPAAAARHVDWLREQYARRTAKGAESLLRSAFERLLPPGMYNPFAARIAGRSAREDGAEIHRRPLTDTQLERLLQVAKDDYLIYPLTVCAMCTGLRIGDVCNLQWESVDLAAGVVRVATAKTGAVVEIPVFGPLREVLESVASGGRGKYVWPVAAKMYAENRSGITYRGKVLFARALGVDSEKERPGRKQAACGDALARCMAAVQASAMTDGKKARILDTLQRIGAGESYREIERITGRPRGQISGDLAEAEVISGARIRKGIARGSVKSLLAATRQSDGHRVLAASIYGWHSLRGTFATMALSAGVPVETVKLITGHATVATILRSYYNPQREHLRKALGDKMPSVITGGAKNETDLSRIAEQIGKLSAEDRIRLGNILKL